MRSPEIHASACAVCGRIALGSVQGREVADVERDESLRAGVDTYGACPDCLAQLALQGMTHAPEEIRIGY